jgi:hypothetical protein
VNRRTLLRYCSTGIGAVTASALAGCSITGGDGGDGGDGGNDNGDGDGGNDDGNGEDGNGNDGADSDEGASTETPTATPTSTAVGSPGTQAGDSGGPTRSAESDVDGLAVESAEYVSGGENFSVRVTVVNTGDQETDIMEYGYQLTVFDGADEDISTSTTSYGTTNETTAPPGESATLTASRQVDGSPDDVARFELVVSCDSAFAEGVYCG